MRQQILILLLSLWTLNAHGQVDTVANDLRSEALDTHQLSIIYDLTKEYAPNGEVAVALITGDQTSFVGARREAGRVVTVDNHDRAFAVGSITKVFTATLLAMMVEEGRVSLTDRVEEAYDFRFADSSSFTYLQLANHTAGLPRLPSNLPITFIDPYHDYTPEKLETYLRDDLKLVTEGQSAYSNLGAGLLGYTLTHKLAATTYGEALENKIFAPLGMEHSSSGPDSTRAELVQGYALDGSQPLYWHFTDAMAGAGSVVSTLEDMVLFLRAQFDTTRTALALTRESTVKLGGPQAIGLGWQILQPEPGRTLYWHNGAVAGYRAFMGVDVENELGVVVFTNMLVEGNAVDNTGMQLLRTLGTK